jgi:ABC-type Fe3+/spermidine/putrescine transport system ATPase subunit
VALARAIIAEPGVLLLDEPLSNLDAKLREEMRSEIKRIQKDTGITMIYVTHDQKEAMSLGDRITVMNEGRIMQTGAPVELYSRPSNRFVASFLGDVNILPGKVAALSGGLAEIETSEGRLKAAAGGSISCGQDVEVAFRTGKPSGQTV